jgi:arylsulfatase A-like enzyme
MDPTMSSLARQRRLPLHAMLAVALLAAACVPGPRGPLGPAPEGRVTQHVLVVSIDGLRPDAIARFGATTLQRLMREGAATLQAQTIVPAKTLPSHTSMLTGVPPAMHGVTWNSDRTGAVDEEGEGPVPDTLPVPTVFALAHDAGFHTAAFFSKAKFHHLQAPGSLDYTQAPRFTLVPWGAQRTSEDAAAYLRRHRPNLAFVHIGEPDYAGHAIGFMTAVYGENVRIADRAVARLIDAADDAYGRGHYTLIVTADHGGHGRTHGADHPLDRTIPWIAWGEGVHAGLVLPPGVRTMDTAATALWLLGVPIPDFWEGRPVVGAFATADGSSRRP